MIVIVLVLALAAGGIHVMGAAPVPLPVHSVPSGVGAGG